VGLIKITTYKIAESAMTARRILMIRLSDRAIIPQPCACVTVSYAVEGAWAATASLRVSRPGYPRDWWRLQ